MDIIFDIVDNILPDTLIIITVIFAEKYNISIGKDSRHITIYLYESNKREVLKFCGSSSLSKKFTEIKEYIQEIVDNVPIHYITGVSSLENKEYLDEYFITSEHELSDSLIGIIKNF